MRGEQRRQSPDPEQLGAESLGEGSGDLNAMRGDGSHGDGAEDATGAGGGDPLGDDGEDDNKDPAGSERGLEAERAPPLFGDWPIIQVDVGLLQDPDADPDGHAAEWRRVYETLDPYLREYFERGVSYDDAQEVIGELWCRATRKIRTLKDPSKMVFWLIKIGRNVLRDGLKSKRRRLERQRTYVDNLVIRDADWRNTILERLSAERLFDDQVDRHEFGRQFAKLSDMDQEFAYLLQVEERSHRELVARFGFTSEDASKSRWQWIRRKLKKALGEPSAQAPRRRGGEATKVRRPRRG